MNMTEKQLNDRIRKMAKNNHISYPENYDAFICRVLEELPEEPEDSERRGRWRRKRGKSGWAPVPALLLVILIVVAAGASVGAVVHGYLQRMETMSERQKEKFVASVEDTRKNGDYYSREFTAEEKERGEALAVEYEAGKCYPKQELPVLEDEERVSAYRVCFLQTSSTFYLPEEGLTDEELLQIIDFYYKREYSMAERKSDIAKENEIEKDFKSTGILSKKEAINLAERSIKSAYGEDVSGWNVETEKYTPYHMEQEYYLFFFENESSKQNYHIEIARKDKECTILEIETKNKSNYKKGIQVSNEEIEQLHKEAIAIINRLQPGVKFEKMECQYVGEKENILSLGVVEFLYSQNNQQGYVINYSMHTKTFFSIIKTQDMSMELEINKKKARKENRKIFSVKFKESNVAEKEAD